MPVIIGNTTVNTSIASSNVTVNVPQGYAEFNATRNSIMPTLRLDFVNSNVLDPRITFARASSATYYNKFGTLTTASSNTPRFDYNPSTLTCNGLLIEQASTNLLLYSATLTNWSTSNITLSSSGTAPDGATSILATENSTTAIHDTAHSGTTITASSTYTFSAFVKYAGRQYVIMNFDNNAGNGFGVVFDLINGLATSSGTNGSGVYTSSVIQPLSNGWYRLIITGNLAATDTSARTSIISSPSSTYSWYPSTTGLNASAFYIYGAQLEQLAIATSYIATAGSTVTRAKDTSYLSLGSWYNSTAFSFLVEAQKNISTDTDNGGPIEFHDSSYLYRFYLLDVSGSTNLAMTEVVNGVYSPADCYITVGARIAGVPYKVSLSAYGSTGVAGAITTSFNGAAVVSGATSNFSGTPYTALQIGSLGSGYVALNGWVRRIAYYPTVLSNAELISQTS